MSRTEDGVTSFVYCCRLNYKCQCKTQFRFRVDETRKSYDLFCNLPHSPESHYGYDGKILAPHQRVGIASVVKADPGTTGTDTARRTHFDAASVDSREKDIERKACKRGRPATTFVSSSAAAANEFASAAATAAANDSPAIFDPATGGGGACCGGPERWSVDEACAFLEATFGPECEAAARANSLDGRTMMDLLCDDHGVALLQLPVDQAPPLPSPPRPVLAIRRASPYPRTGFSLFLAFAILRGIACRSRCAALASHRRTRRGEIERAARASCRR